MSETDSLDGEQVASATAALALNDIHVQLILVSHDDLSNAPAFRDGAGSSTDVSTFMSQAIAIANVPYAAAGLRFVFDPTRDVMRINSTFLSRTCTLSAPYTVPSTTPDDLSAASVCNIHPNEDARNALAQTFPGKVVVYVSSNDIMSLGTMDQANVWDFRPGFNYSSEGVSFVALASGNTPEVFAHEVGHYLHLAHPMPDGPGYPYTVADAQAIIKQAVLNTGNHNYAAGTAAFDADGLSDTPPDTGSDVFRSAGIDPCLPGATGTLTINVDFGTGFGVHAFTFTPDRYNVMNYWDKTARCLNHAADISAQQVARVRAALDTGNRHGLLSYNATPDPMSFALVNKNSGKVAAITGMSTTFGAQVVQWTDNATLDQRFRLDSIAGAYANIENVNSNLVMAVTGMSTAAGATVVQWNYNATPDQLWQLVDDGLGYAKIVNKNSGMLWAVEGASLASGGRVLQYFDTGTPDQHWLLSPKGRMRISNTRSGKVLAVSSASTSNNAGVVQLTDNGTTAEQWQFLQDANGYFRIQNVNSGRVLALSTGSTQLVQLADDGSSSHLWRVRFDSNAGQFRIQNMNGKVLGVSGASTADNAAVVQSTDTGAADHLWQLL